MTKNGHKTNDKMHRDYLAVERRMKLHGRVRFLIWGTVAIFFLLALLGVL